MKSLEFITLYRSLTRSPLYTALNVGGLAVGIAVFIILSLFVRFETSYEHWLPDFKKTYVLRTHIESSGLTASFPKTMGGLLEELQQQFPGIHGTRMAPFEATIVKNGSASTEKLVEVDRNFLKIISLPLKTANGSNPLSDASAILLSESAARKYFPNETSIGKSLEVRINGNVQLYKVAGVFFNLPSNTEMNFDLVVRFPATPTDPSWNHWGNVSVYTYLRFDSAAAASAFAKRLPMFVNRRASDDLGPSPEKILSLPLSPIEDIHLLAPGRSVMVTTLGLVGLLTLIIAVVNYINLTTARASARAREVAVRKVLGASRGLLQRQFLLEAVMTVAIAAALGLALTEMTLPLVNAVSGMTLKIPYVPIVLLLLLLIAIVGILAGLYPAILLSRSPITAVLSSAQAPGGGRASGRVREVLVVLQFVLATAFLIGTGVLVAQIRHVQSADLGFSREKIIIIPSLRDSSLDRSRRNQILRELAQLKGVQSVSQADAAPGDETLQLFDNVPIPRQPQTSLSVQHITVGDDFFNTMGTRLLAGRSFDKYHRVDDSAILDWADVHNIVINRQAAMALGFASPEAAIGKNIRPNGQPSTIIGVVEDFRFYSPRSSLTPALFQYKSIDINKPIALVRTTGNSLLKVEEIREIWRETFPDIPFKGITANQSLEGYYSSDQRTARLFAIGAGLSVLIGCIGLWGLASFTTARRVREIGIRKTLGASSVDIVWLLITQFLRPVLVSNLFAWPLAYFALETWLAGYDDRVGLSIAYFVGASGIAATIAIATVITQSLRASRATPAWALRHE